MKIIKIILSFIGVIFFVASFTSCKREVPRVADNTTNVANMASIQIFSATVNAARNNVYVDGFTVNGNGSLLAYKGIIPSQVASYAFLVNPGARTIQIKDTLTTTTQSPLTFTQNYGADTSYTIFTYDTITSIKQITVVNNITTPTDSTCMLRFANFIYNPTAVPSVDVYSFKRNNPTFVSGLPVFSGATPVFSNIATTQVTNFIPFATGITDTLYVVATGTTSPILAKQAFVVNTVPVPQRSYTAVYNGSYRAAAKTLTYFATY